MPPKKKPSSGKEPEEHMTRIAIISAERCRPKKCNQECKKSCPVVKLGKLCIEVTNKSKLAFISETLCIGEYIKNIYTGIYWRNDENMKRKENVEIIARRGVMSLFLFLFL